MGLLKKAKSFVKKTVRKVVPKELSGIMTAAALLLHHKFTSSRCIIYWWSVKIW